MGKLSKIILADNQLSVIPYLALSPLKFLRYLDLSHNKINTMQLNGEVNVQERKYDVVLSLDELRLDFNQITQLEPISFNYFDVLNKTWLDGNHLMSVEVSNILFKRLLIDHKGGSLYLVFISHIY